MSRLNTLFGSYLEPIIVIIRLTGKHWLNTAIKTTTLEAKQKRQTQKNQQSAGLMVSSIIEEEDVLDGGA